MPSVHTYTSREKWEENHKVTKESQNVKGMMNSGTGKAISHRCEISHHGAKFSHCGAKFSASLFSLLLLLLSF